MCSRPQYAATMSKLSLKQPDIEFQVELEENPGSKTEQAINPTKDVSYKINFLHAHASEVLCAKVYLRRFHT